VTATTRAKNNGEKNLIPVTKRSKEEARQMSSKGGKASGEARRRKRDTRQAAKFVLELEPDLSKDTRKALMKMGLKPEDIPDIRLISLLAIAQKAMKGDLQANKMLLELSGDIDARLKIEQEKLELERERLEFAIQRGGDGIDDSLPQIVIERTATASGEATQQESGEGNGAATEDQ
jgi:hypothetical protein